MINDNDEGPVEISIFKDRNGYALVALGVRWGKKEKYVVSFDYNEDKCRDI